eukprot:2221634-Rhodomonas_salina.2
MAFAYFGMIFVLPIYIDTYGSLHGYAADPLALTLSCCLAYAAATRWSQGAKDITLVIVAASGIALRARPIPTYRIALRAHAVLTQRTARRNALYDSVRLLRDARY